MITYVVLVMIFYTIRRNFLSLLHSMLSPEESTELADILFPNVTQSIADIEATFLQELRHLLHELPQVLRFLHIGALYMTLINGNFTHQNNGVFFLRINDTDDKRETETEYLIFSVDSRDLGTYR